MVVTSMLSFMEDRSLTVRMSSSNLNDEHLKIGVVGIIDKEKSTHQFVIVMTTLCSHTKYTNKLIYFVFFNNKLSITLICFQASCLQSSPSAWLEANDCRIWEHSFYSDLKTHYIPVSFTFTYLVYFLYVL